MSDFRFATPEWSAALWVVLVIVVLLFWLERRRGDALSRFMSPIMQSRLVARSSAIRRSLVILLLAMAATCFILALMRPQFGLTYVKSPRIGAQIMFCLDVSKSMLAEDVAPNRLERAKADISDLLTFLDGDQVGLIGFAGRASVLCPLTPDYGFFKLILDNANPTSVGRGGTRLEEPIRKALNGFRTESDVSRIIFLITDGEDHDSHPLDAAQEAVERGIKVVAVGLGDEAGSEIRITDSRTGVQSQVLDADGNPVITRLDGETLRELALATEGVYIPGGTGSLDLKSIYDAHIKPLVRAEMQSKGRAIRQDAFQWAILAGLIALMASVVLGSGRATESSDQALPVSSGIARAAVLLAMLFPGHQPLALADQRDSIANNTVSQTDPDQQLNPRQIYNQGLQQLQSDLGQAESLLSKARREAASDGEVRFRATFNMGWVEVNRADELIDKQPEKSLEHLQRAAGWFRKAVRLRKDAPDARHNLEVVLLRVLQLRDQLFKQDDKDLAAQLDALITNQRQTISNLRSLVEQIAASDDPNIADKFRSQFQRLAVDQRVALSDLQDVVEKAAGELETLENKPESERSAEENIRMAQLAGLLGYLNQGNQRLGQSRSQLRRRQAARGFRRAAAGLNQLKRARDQLRGPLEILDGMLADARATAQQTALKSLDNQIVAADQGSLNVPSWIDQDYLVDSQADLTQRSEELTTRLAAGLENASWQQSQKNDADDSQQAAITAEQQDFLAKLQAAMPHLLEATEAMKLAGEKMSLPEYSAASEQQVKAIKALQEAREQFADLRGLIELAYATQTKIIDALNQLLGSQDPADVEAWMEIASEDGFWDDPIVGFAKTEQAKNRLRMDRLKKEIAKERAQVDSGQEHQDPNSAGTVPAEVQRLDLAAKLVDRAIEQMERAADSLQGASESSDIAKSGPYPDAIAAAETLTELRRLFFSVVEHLQETAQRQAQLNDETEQLAGLQNESETDDEAKHESAAQLASRQDELAKIAAQIATALQQQANQPTTAAEQQAPANPEQQNMIEQNAQKAKQAAELVSEAKQQMTAAHEQLAAKDPKLSDARPPQDAALEKLIEALAQLQPPQPNQDQQQQQQDNQQQDQQQQQAGENQQQEKASQHQDQIDPSRLLQAVRDREAQRRRDRDRRQSIGQVPVEKDW